MVRKQAACRLRPDPAYHRRAAVDHIQFNRYGVADVDNTLATIGPAISNARNRGSTVAHIGNKHSLGCAN
jgi:hypothetical protein